MSGYRIVNVLPLNKKKYKISMEGTESIIISLYPSELRKYDVKEGNTLSEAEYNRIKDVLYKRGKERALYYLKTSDKTSSQMRKKLSEGFYPKDVIDKIIQFLEEYKYIDDLRYANQYVQYNIKRKSLNQIKNDLRQKGICREDLDNVLLEVEDNIEGNPQTDIIRKYILKKHKTDLDIKEKNKIVMALVRKGFRFDYIISVYRRVEREEEF